MSPHVITVTYAWDRPGRRSITGVEPPSQPLRTAGITGASTLAATVLVHLWDPNQGGSYGFCPLRLATGWVCPLCGGLRSVHALTHGQPDLAWGLNPLVVTILPLAIVAWAIWMARAFRGLPTTWAERLTFFVPAMAVLVMYGIARNTPALEPYLAALT
ncbi:DUF2752 domain-containing protein [soil metagenome]